ncbi:MAG: hypothetical protein KAG61_14280, partial [Bacteriovoracaceae bacterium]|nr:hypothetical protein [Bacteriovoracaceae bacterium]
NGIDEDNEEFLMPSHLYDYFEPLISKDTGVGGAYRIALVAEEAFNKIEQEDSLSREIVSIVALASVIKNARVIPSTKKFLTQSLCTMAHATQVEAAIKDLVEKKVLLYNRMIGQYELQQGSSVDIQEEIEKLRSKKLTSKDLTSIVKRYYPVDYIIPKRYNFEHSITRFYKNEIISVEELVQGKISTNPNYSTEDALLYYVIPFDQDELNLAKRYIEEIDHKLVAFVLPKSFVECRKDIEELNAINSLFSNRELLSAGPLVKKELEKHRDITLNAIHALLDSLVGKSRLSATIYYPRKSKQYSAESYSLLQRVLGDVLEEEYSRSVDINSELINKHKVSGTVSLARRKLIDSIGKNFDQKRLGIEGNGPEYAIYKALQGLSGFKYDEIMKRYALNDDRFTSLLKDYKNFIKTNVRGVTMEEIISFFIAPPFGLRRGVIPLYLALFDKCLTHPVNHYFDSKYQTIVDGDHYDLMLKHPKLSIIQYTDISEKKIGFLKSLESIFKVNESDITVYSVVESIFKWRKSIPDSTKASHSISVEGRKLLIAIDSSKEPDRLVFNLIPAALGIGDDIEDLSDEKILDLAKNLFKEIGLINNIYPMLVRSIKTSLYQNLNFWRVRCLGVSEVKEDKSGNVAKHYHETLTLFEETLLNYPFSKATSKLLGRISTFDSSKHPQYFIETVADSLTGVNPRHWDIKHQSLFDVALKQSQSEIEMVSEFVNPEFKGKTAVAFIDNETGEKKYIKLSDRSLLSTDIQNAAVKIEQILDKLSIEERNEILLRLLNPVLTQNGNVKKTTLKK